MEGGNEGECPKSGEGEGKQGNRKTEEGKERKSQQDSSDWSLFY